MRLQFGLRGLSSLLLLLGAIVALVAYFGSTPSPLAQTGGDQSGEATGLASGQVEVFQISPDPPETAAVKAQALPPGELARLHRAKLELRRQTAERYAAPVAGPPGLPHPAGRETVVGNADEAARFHGNPGAFMFGRNNPNTNANNPAKASTLAEPAAANSGARVFAAGNFNHAEHSTNGGLTWTDVVLPGGPVDAPNLCCDHDVVIDDARRVVIHSAMYLNSGPTNGVVRIFVRQVIPTAACSFTIDPGGTGDNLIPDYPHIGLTKRFLYLTINAVGAGGGFSRIYRFNLDQIVDCVPGAAVTTFTQPFSAFGQRVWVPAEGTNNLEAMYWAQHDSTTVVRIFRWLESAAAPTAFARAVAASTFAIPPLQDPPDCRGGITNADWADGIGTSIAGFGHRMTAAPGARAGQGLLALFWPVAPDAVHTQGHIHGAIFDLASVNLLSQPSIFSNSFCYGKPAVTANKRGDLGIVLAFGGRAGGGGDAARVAVGIDDEFTSGLGNFSTVFPVASGTHNRPDQRYGDYFTIRPHEPCEKWFVATGYVLDGGTAVSNVNSRYVEFGRKQSFRCYNSHRNQLPNQSVQ